MGKNNSPWPYRPLSPLRDEFFAKAKLMRLFWASDEKRLTLFVATEQSSSFWAIFNSLDWIFIQAIYWQVGSFVQLTSTEGGVQLDLSAEPYERDANGKMKPVIVPANNCPEGVEVSFQHKAEKRWRTMIVRHRGGETCQTPVHSFLQGKK